MTDEEREHYERLCAMRDDEGLTWDLSGADQAAFRWALEQIDGRAAALAAERERCARVCERLGSQLDGTMDQHRDHSWQQSMRDKIGMADKCAAAIRVLGESE